MNIIANIGTLIKLFRRLLLLGLVILCLYLFYKEKAKEASTQGNQAISVEWGSPAEKLAREMDMPIFFSIKDNFKKEALNEDIIKEHFIYTQLDPALYPADYMALKALHCNTGKNVDITCGVLTSKMYPILTSTNSIWDAKDSDSQPCILSTLKGIISIYHENYNRFLKISKSFYLLNDIPSKYHIDSLKEDMSKLSFMLDFGYHEKFKPAQLSESARLSFRNCTVEKYSPFKTKLKDTAYKEIVDKAKEGKTLNFIERSFYLRALSDFILIFNNRKNEYLLKDFADEITASQESDGSFLIEGSKNTLYNAFSMTILSYAYKITKNEPYKDAIDKFCVFLNKELRQRHNLPADFKEGGIAGAKDYVYLSRALLNAYIASDNKKSLVLTRQLLLRLSRNHQELHSMVLELSKESTLSKYINLCSVEDDDFTSTNGVLLQVYCDMKLLSLSNNLDEKINNIFNSTLNSTCSDIDFDFSLRLAKHPNPLICIENLQNSKKNLQEKDK